LRIWLAVAVLLIAPRFLNANTIVLNFESFTDSDILTNQIAGVTFTNTVVLTAGISLNEIDFPPHSGVNVVFDNNGPITIAFANPITQFAAYFTYVEPLTLAAFNASNTKIGSALSLFSINTATGGAPGSSPNELIQFNSATGISKVTIAGDPAGGSFVMDDVTLTTPASTVPEPTTACLMLAALTFIRRRTR